MPNEKDIFERHFVVRKSGNVADNLPATFYVKCFYLRVRVCTADSELKCDEQNSLRTGKRACVGIDVSPLSRLGFQCGVQCENRKLSFAGWYDTMNAYSENGFSAQQYIFRGVSDEQVYFLSSPLFCRADRA